MMRYISHVLIYMSLLITRNDKDGQPESYHNFLRDTFEVPPNSEIAVHTCVINRDPTYVVNDTCVFYVYHGGYLSDADVEPNEAGKEAYLQYYGMSSLWVDQPIQIIMPKGDYSLNGFTEQIQASLNKYDFHPSFQGTWTCEAARAADGSFNGFKIENVQRGLDASSDETGITAEQLGGLTFTAGTQRLARNASGVGMKMSRLNSPLNGAKGAVVFKVDNIGTAKDWAIGLRRIYFDNYAKPHDKVPQMDFMVYYDSTLGFLQYYEYTWDEATDKLILKSRSYQGSDYSTFYDFKTNTDNIQYIKFELNNQKVTVSLADDYSGEPYTYKTLTTSYKAVGYSTYTLYPAVGITEETKYVTLQSFNRVPYYISGTRGARLFTYYHRSDVASLVTAMTQKLVSTSDATALDLHTALIVGDGSSDYEVIGTAMDELGYEVSIDEGSIANPKTIMFASQAVPDMISSDVLHVRVNALDVRSYNGVQSSISKILYTLPRFNNGSASGRMHIVPHEKTYLALNNTNTLHINDIHVEFVNSDESLATDLTDKAMVIFHIKAGAGCGCSG